MILMGSETDLSEMIDTDAEPAREQKRAALSFLSDAWSDAIEAGVEPDALAHAALFTALADLVGAYGEAEVARFAAGLSRRIGRGEFTVPATQQ